MSKLWYPVALSFTLVNCGGETDSDHTGTPTGGSTQSGTSTPTGGSTQASTSTSTGGRSQMDTGTPVATGGTSLVIAPPYGVQPPESGGSIAFGGMPAMTGGKPATGGRSSIDTGTPRYTGGRPPVIYGVIGLLNVHWRARLLFK